MSGSFGSTERTIFVAPPCSTRVSATKTVANARDWVWCYDPTCTSWQREHVRTRDLALLDSRVVRLPSPPKKTRHASAPPCQGVTGAGLPPFRVQAKAKFVMGTGSEENGSVLCEEGRDVCPCWLCGVVQDCPGATAAL
eukprot:3582799-Rhodomonas_salina.1